MTALAPIVVQATPLETGELVLQGIRDDRKRIPPAGLKTALFTWHEPSFYGSQIETQQIGGREELILPGQFAIAYLASPQPNRLTPIVWSDPLPLISRLARIYREALAEGRFVPSYGKMTLGQPGWTLLLEDGQRQEYSRLLEEAAAAGFPRAETWFDRCIDAWIRHDQALSKAWAEVLAAHTAFAATASAAAHGGTQAAWPDEDDWLTAIGWKSDSAPFVVCVQLCEPDDERGWTLRLPLQDRHNAERLFDDSVDEAERIPDQWLPDVTVQRAKAIRKLLRVAPELRAAGGGGGSGGGSGGGGNFGGDFGAGDGGDGSGYAPVRSGRSPDSAAGGDHATECAPDSSTSVLLRELTDEQAWTFLERTSMELASAGFRVLLPVWWDEVRRLKPRLKAKVRSSVGSPAESLLGLDQLVKFDWKVAVGDIDLSEDEFRQLAETQKRFARVRGRWVVLDPALLHQIQLRLKRGGNGEALTFGDVLGLHFAGELDDDETGATGMQDAEGAAPRVLLEVELNEHLLQLVARLQETAAIPSFTVPAGLNGTLRKYQADGAAWLAFLRRFGLGGCLADDMGLGKTVQFIAYLLQMREASPDAPPALLIAPTSVLGNWQKELERFAPELKAKLHYGSQREKGSSFATFAADADLVLTSYTLAHLDEEELRSLRWSCICLDEAQNIKNAYTKQASAIRRLEAHHRVALTGTPIENRLTELWSIFDFINPGYMGSLNEFNRRYVGPIEKTNDPARIAQVQRLVRPFLMRRMKKDPAIQLDLPEKNEAKAYVSLTAEQGAIYEQVVRDTLEQIEKLSGMERRGLILATLTKLKQICNHPALYAKGPAASNSTTATEVRSNKIARLLDMTREAREEGDRCLIFTQYVEMGHMLVDIVGRELDEPVFFLHGGVPKAKRDRMTAAFQNPDERCGIFVLSLKAGGTGLNLTAANHVFHVDRWWNPAVEEQATDRAFRIGQTRDVQVHKFVTLGTLEERIDDMIERKSGLSKQIVGSGESWITELSTAELRDLFTLRREWIDK